MAIQTTRGGIAGGKALAIKSPGAPPLESRSPGAAPAASASRPDASAPKALSRRYATLAGVDSVGDWLTEHSDDEQTVALKRDNREVVNGATEAHKRRLACNSSASNPSRLPAGVPSVSAATEPAQSTLVSNVAVQNNAIQSASAAEPRERETRDAEIMQAVLNTGEWGSFFVDTPWKARAATLGRITREIEARVRYLLDQVSDPTIFKFGITAESCMQYRAYRYFMEGMREFRTVFRSTEPAVVEMLEVYLIRVFEEKKKSENRGKYLQCVNSQPGAEGKMRRSGPPYVIYMAQGTAGELERLSRVRKRCFGV